MNITDGLRAPLRRFRALTRWLVFAGVAVFGLALLPSAGHAAERIAVLPFSGTNVHPGLLQAAQELLRDHLSTSGRFQAMISPGEPLAAELGVAEASVRGKAVGCELVVATHLTHLESLVRIRVTVYRVATGDLLFTDNLSTTGGPDQLDPVLKRLAAAITTGKRSADSAEIDTVTQGESNAYLKQTASKVFGLKLGMLAPLSRPAGRDPAIAPSLGVFWLYDARNFLAEAFIDFATQDALAAFNIGIGVYHPFEQGSTTPYIGGGIAWSAVNFGGGGQNGLRLHGAAGMLLGRLSTVQFRGEVGYFVNTFSERDVRDVYVSLPSQNASTGDSTVSHGPMLTVGLGF